MHQAHDGAAKALVPVSIYYRMPTAFANVMQGIAEGTPVQGTLLICDVRDVARAHVLAAEIPGASGRYIVSHRAPITATALSKALQVDLSGPPQLALPPYISHACHPCRDNHVYHYRSAVQRMHPTSTLM